MAANVFINYRREISQGDARSIYQYLRQKFSAKNLFMDVDALKPGVDFIKELQAQVAKCDVFLVLIGKDWAEVRDERGRRRIDNPYDFVRIEIASALQYGKRVIPILLDNAQMPRAEDLPIDIRAISHRNAIRVRHESFGADADVIVAAVRDTSAAYRKQRSRPYVIVLMLVAALFIGGGLAWLKKHFEPAEQTVTRPE